VNCYSLQNARRCTGCLHPRLSAFNDTAEESAKYKSVVFVIVRPEQELASKRHWLLIESAVRMHDASTLNPLLQSCNVDLDNFIHDNKLIITFISEPRLSANAIGVRVNLFSGAEKNISTAPDKTAVLTCKIALPDSHQPIFISKNPGFRALHLAGRNDFRVFRLKILF